MADFEQLDRVFELAHKNPNDQHFIDKDIAVFIIVNSLAEDLELEWKDKKLTAKIVYRGVTFLWKTETKPWEEITKKFVH